MATTNTPDALARALLAAALDAQAIGIDGDAETEPVVTVELRIPFSVLHALQTVDERYYDVLLPEEFCQICGCTNSAACEGGCSWVGPHLCSSCIGRVPLLIKQASEVEG